MNRAEILRQLGALLTSAGMIFAAADNAQAQERKLHTETRHAEQVSKDTPRAPTPVQLGAKQKAKLFKELAEKSNVIKDRNKLTAKNIWPPLVPMYGVVMPDDFFLAPAQKIRQMRKLRADMAKIIEVLESEEGKQLRAENKKVQSKYDEIVRSKAQLDAYFAKHSAHTTRKRHHRKLKRHYKKKHKSERKKLHEQHK